MTLSWAAGCAHPDYAQVETTDSQSESGYWTEILSIDGKAPTSRNLKVRPGHHTIEAEGHCLGTGAVGVGAGALVAYAINRANATRSGSLEACFLARGDRMYEVRTYKEGGVWQIQVVDQHTTYDVKSPCKRRP